MSNRNCSDSEIDDILNTARVFNKTKNITGLLLYTDIKFVQILEGDEKDIANLYHSILKDKRHNSPILIANDIKSERSFPSWQMAGKKIGGKEVDYLSNISIQEKSVFENVLAGNKENGFMVLELLKRFFYV